MLIFLNAYLNKDRNACPPHGIDILITNPGEICTLYQHRGEIVCTQPTGRGFRSFFHVAFPVCIDTISARPPGTCV